MSWSGGAKLKMTTEEVHEFGDSLRSTKHRYGAKDHFVGIDFGNCYCSIGYLDGQIFRKVENIQGKTKTPCCVAFSADGRLIGNPALNYLTVDPANTITGIKHLLGYKYSEINADERLRHYKLLSVEDKLKVEVNYKGQQKRLFVEDITAMILANLKSQAEKSLKRGITHAVVTVPTYFNSRQRQAMLDAGKIAGLELRLVNDSTVLAWKYCLTKTFTEKKIYILVFIFGGGSLEISIATIDKDVCHIVASNGTGELGGVNIDREMADHCIRGLGKHLSQPLLMQRLLREAAKAKIVLSTAPVASIEIPSENDNFYNFTYPRKDLNELLKATDQVIRDVINKTLKEARLDPADISDIILSGGSSRIPYIKQSLRGIFKGKTLINTYQTDESLVEGAAMIAHLVERHQFFDYTNVRIYSGSSSPMKVILGSQVIEMEKCKPVPYQKTCLLKGASVDTMLKEPIKVLTGENQYIIGSFIITENRATIRELEVNLEVDINGVFQLKAQYLVGAKPSLIATEGTTGILDGRTIEMSKLDASEYNKDEESKMQSSIHRNNLEECAFKYCDMFSNAKGKYGIDEAVRNKILNKCQEVLDNIEGVKPCDYQAKQRELEGMAFSFERQFKREEQKKKSKQCLSRTIQRLKNDKSVLQKCGEIEEWLKLNPNVEADDYQIRHQQLEVEVNRVKTQEKRKCLSEAITKYENELSPHKGKKLVAEALKICHDTREEIQKNKNSSVDEIEAALHKLDEKCNPVIELLQDSRAQKLRLIQTILSVKAETKMKLEEENISSETLANLRMLERLCNVDTQQMNVMRQPALEQQHNKIEIQKKYLEYSYREDIIKDFKNFLEEIVKEFQVIQNLYEFCHSMLESNSHQQRSSVHVEEFIQKIKTDMIEALKKDLGPEKGDDEMRRVHHNITYQLVTCKELIRGKTGTSDFYEKFKTLSSQVCNYNKRQHLQKYAEEIKQRMHHPNKSEKELQCLQKCNEILKWLPTRTVTIKTLEMELSGLQQLVEDVELETQPGQKRKTQPLSYDIHKIVADIRRKFQQEEIYVGDETNEHRKHLLCMCDNVSSPKYQLQNIHCLEDNHAAIVAQLANVERLYKLDEAKYKLGQYASKCYDIVKLMDQKSPNVRDLLAECRDVINVFLKDKRLKLDDIKRKHSHLQDKAWKENIHATPTSGIADYKEKLKQILQKCTRDATRRSCNLAMRLCDEAAGTTNQSEMDKIDHEMTAVRRHWRNEQALRSLQRYVDTKRNMEFVTQREKQYLDKCYDYKMRCQTYTYGEEKVYKDMESDLRRECPEGLATVYADTVFLEVYAQSIMDVLKSRNVPGKQDLIQNCHHYLESETVILNCFELARCKDIKGELKRHFQQLDKKGQLEVPLLLQELDNLLERVKKQLEKPLLFSDTEKVEMKKQSSAILTWTKQNHKSLAAWRISTRGNIQLGSLQALAVKIFRLEVEQL